MIGTIITAKTIGNTWTDMLDINNIWQWCPPEWYENWNGKISRIDELRCDGVIEYRYEKNGLFVSNDKNIGHSGNSNVYGHNEWHDGWADIYGNGAELCPRFQAGEPPNQYHPRYV